MTNPRFLFRLFVAAFAALVVLIIYFSGFPHWLILSALALLLGLGFGLLLRRLEPPRRELGPAESGTRYRADFSSALPDVAVNEMREGLLVIDAEMRVVFSNRAARNLFSHVEEAINLRRLTELTRNPAIYDAFLDVTRLERLELVRQEFLSNVSHELRTPLTSIMALTETLAAGAIDDQEHNRRFLLIIQRNAARMHRLIDDILELSAIEAGNVKVRPETVQLYALVEDVSSGLSASAAARNITVRNLVATEVKVFADPHRLVQKLTNLIDNAIKFNREGGTVSIKYSSDDGDRISVADTGEGIPAHHLDRLFERFYRADRARSRQLGGTALGLAIVKHLAKAHGGEVTVESRFGEGTQFTIELPRLTDDPAERQRALNATE